MKKLVLSLIVIGFLVPTATFASDPLSSQIAAKAGYGSATETTLSQQIGGVIKTVLSLTGIIFLALTVYAGVLWMTAAGEEEKVTKATNIIKMSVIGLIIILSSYSLTYFVLKAVYGGAGEQAAGGAPTGVCCQVHSLGGAWLMGGDQYQIVENMAECRNLCTAVGSECTQVNMSTCAGR